LFDIDDADYISPYSKGAVDECLHDAAAVVAGSRAVAAYCGQINSHVDIVWTGSPVSDKLPEPQNSRSSTVTWAASSPLGSPREADFLLEVLALVARTTTDFKFRLYADDGSAAYRDLVRRFSGLGLHVETFGYMPYSKFLASLDDVAIGLAPLIDLEGFSGGKSFGKVLAYLDKGVPVLTHPVVDHPQFFENGITGIMANGASTWASHICRLLLDAEEREKLAIEGRRAFRDRLSIEVSAARVERILRTVIETRRSTTP
jgi:glycosyltransferase involved in cell wall biosynthesis